MKKFIPYGLIAILILAAALSGCGGGSGGGGGGNNGGGNSGGGGGTTPASWQVVGSPGFSAGRADYTSLAIDGSGVPYVAYQDWGNGGKATVMKYSGGAWATVGSAGFSAGEAAYTSLAIDGCFVTIRNGGFYQLKIPEIIIRNSLVLTWKIPC